MIKSAMKLSAAAIIAAMLLGSNGVDVQAEGVYSNTAVAGITVSIDEYVASQPDEKPAEVKATKTKKSVDTKKSSDKKTKTDKKKAEAKETSKYDKIVVPKVENFLNVRKKGTEDSKIVGKLYKGSAATIVKKGKEWTKVKSGTVTGYVKNDFLVTGKDVETYADEICDKAATVNTTTLYVREKKSTDSKVVTMIPEGEEYEVVKEYKNWVKLKVDEDVKGYVAKDYVDVELQFDKAISIKEEKAKKEAQERQAAAEQAAAAQASASTSAPASSSSSNNSSSNAPASRSASAPAASTPAPKSTPASTGTSATRQNIVNYALQFVGNPYVYGGTSLTNGADCSGFTMSVYKHFGININRSSRAQVNNGTNISVSSVKPGDLIFYASGGTIGHVAMYIGGGQVVHASSSKTGIIKSNMYYRTPYKATRIIND